MAKHPWTMVAVTVAFTMCASGDLPTATTNSIDRYKAIVERPPFKKSSLGAAPPAQSSIQGLLLTGIFVEGATRKVWIRDTRTNQSYGVCEGETVLDFRVEKIDPENQTVILTRGVETQSLTFPKTPVPPAPVLTTGFQPRPLLRVPGHPPQPNPTATVTTTTIVNPGAGAVAAISVQTATNAASPRSLRRRILQQNLNVANRPAGDVAAPAQEAAKDGLEAEPAAEQTQATE